MNIKDCTDIATNPKYVRKTSDIRYELNIKIIIRLRQGQRLDKRLIKHSIKL